MKAKKYGVYISISIIIVFSVMLLVFTKYENKMNEVWSNLIIGIIGSAVVTFILTLTEYIVEKRNALENYYNEAYKIWFAFNKIEYYAITPRVMASAKYLTAIAFQNTLNRKNDNAINELIDFYDKNNGWQNYPETLLIEDKKEIAINNAKIDEESILNAMKGYLSFENLSYESMERGFGQLSFLVCSRKRKKSLIRWLYYEIHDKIRDFINTIKLENYHFKLYEKGENKNILVIADKIKKLNDKLFKNEEDESFIKTYAQFANDIQDTIETFRAKIYGCEKQKFMIVPIHTIWKIKTDEQE